MTEAGQKQPETVIKRLTYQSELGEKKRCQGAALGPDWHAKFQIQGPAGDLMPNIHVEYETEVKTILTNGQQGDLIRIKVKPTIKNIISEFPSDLKDWPLALELSNGTFLGCDLVVNAIGVIPNCKPFEGLLELADDKIGSGILIDKMMKTSVPGLII